MQRSAQGKWGGPLFFVTLFDGRLDLPSMIGSSLYFAYLLISMRVSAFLFQGMEIVVKNRRHKSLFFSIFAKIKLLLYADL